MPPQLGETIALVEDESPTNPDIVCKSPIDKSEEHVPSNSALKIEQYKYEYNWIYIFVLAYFQLSGMYGVYLMATSAKFYTTIFGKLLQVNFIKI